MAIDTEIVGKTTSRSKVVVERAPVSNFALAVQDENPIYRDPEAAKAAGFDSIPAPPTFPFVMEHWGRFDEIQPEETIEGNPMFEALRPLMAAGGLMLHGEQEFIYHRPVEVGDVLRGEGTCVDAYEKESKGKTMTFLVSETVWTDDRTGEPVVTSRFNLIHRS